jgi:hypothetical protein
MTGTCKCQYPYAGEQCDTLAIPYSTYILQVLVLVSTNFASIPAIITAYNISLYYISITMSISTLASLFYHLCDMDTYCIYNISFTSLQIPDVLFSIVNIIVIILLYSAIPIYIQVNMCIVVIALLLPFVSNNPTNAMNVIVSIVCTIIIVICSHIIEYYKLQNACNNIMNGIWYRIHRGAMYNPVNDINNSSIHTSSTVQQNDVELTLFNHDENISDNNSSRNIVDTVIHSSIDGNSNNSTPSTFMALLYSLRYTIVGGILGGSGLMCFAIQDRETYWYVHSIWHMCMMFAAYMLVIGRKEFFAYLEYVK